MILSTNNGHPNYLCLLVWFNLAFLRNMFGRRFYALSTTQVTTVLVKNLKKLIKWNFRSEA